MEDAVDIIGELHIHPGLAGRFQRHLYVYLPQIYIVVHIVLFPLVNLHQDFPLVIAGGDKPVHTESRQGGIAFNHRA